MEAIWTLHFWNNKLPCGQKIPPFSLTIWTPLSRIHISKEFEITTCNMNSLHALKPAKIWWLEILVSQLPALNFRGWVKATYFGTLTKICYFFLWCCKVQIGSEKMAWTLSKRNVNRGTLTQANFCFNIGLCMIWNKGTLSKHKS